MKAVQRYFLAGGALLGASLSAFGGGEEFLLNGDFSRPEGGGPEVEAWDLVTPFTGKRVPHADGGYCLSLEAESDDVNVTWVQRGIRLNPGGNYRVTYRAKAEPGQRYRGYVEYWSLDKAAAYPQGAQWRVGNGNWQEQNINVTYKEGMMPPYIALNVEAPGKALFAHVTITDLDAQAHAASNDAFALERWKLDSQARVVDSIDGRVIELRSPGESERSAISVEAQTLTPGQRYRLSYEVKTPPREAATSTGFQYFRVFTGKAGGAPLEGGDWQDCFEAWQTRYLAFTAGEDGKARFVAELKAPGVLLIRNFSLEAMAEEETLPFAVELTQPVYRQTLYGSESRIAGVIRVTGEGVESVELTLEQGGRTVASETLRGGKGSLPFSFDATQLAEGEAQLHVRALAGKEERGRDHVSLIKVPERTPSVRVGEDLVMRQDGKPFFPIVLWAIPNNHRQLHDLHHGGFNTFVAPLRKELLDTAARFNMKLVGDLVSPRMVPRENDPTKFPELEGKLRETVERYSQHPALLAWYIADEPLWTGRPLPTLRWTYSQLRKLDPYHPVWINEAPRNTIPELARYATAADLFGVDIYPVPQGGTHSELEDRSLSSVGKYTERFHETVAHRKPIWMVLQGFAWLNLHDRKVDGIYPTWEENRFMAYNAIVHGAHGLVYWGTPLINDPAFWDSLLRTTREIADLSAVLVEPTVKEDGLKADHAAIAILHKRHGKDDYFLVINESDQPVEAGFQLNAVADQLHVHFEERALPVQAGRFHDQFKPWDVHVYSTSGKLPPPLVETLEGLPSDGESYQEAARKRKAYSSFQSKANWIWLGPVTPKETVRFRRAFSVREGLKRAMLWITGDDFYEVYLDGKKIGGDLGLGPAPEERGGWMTLEGYDLSAKLSGGQHLLAVEVSDAGQPPAGLVVDLRLEYQGGRTEFVLSDDSWKASRENASGWNAVGFNDTAWAAASVTAPFGQGPWGDSIQPVLIP